MDPMLAHGLSAPSKPKKHLKKKLSKCNIQLHTCWNKYARPLISLINKADAAHLNCPWRYPLTWSTQSSSTTQMSDYKNMGVQDCNKLYLLWPSFQILHNVMTWAKTNPTTKKQTCKYCIRVKCGSDGGSCGVVVSSFWRDLISMTWP